MSAALKPPPDIRPDMVRDVWSELRALTIVNDQGWAEYTAGDLGPREHIVRLSDGRYRTLCRGEAWWWARGLADVHGQGALLDSVAVEPLPKLVTLEQAAAAIPPMDRLGRSSGPAMTVDGIVRNIGSDRLYPFYPHPRQKLLFRAQVDYESRRRNRTIAEIRTGRDASDRTNQATARALRHWLDIRQGLPPLQRISALAVNVSPQPSPDPLPIAAAFNGPKRCRHALILAEKLGWLTFRSDDGGNVITVEGRDGTSVERSVPNARTATPGVLPTAGALAYVLGVADGQTDRKASKRIAYREGLG